MVIYCSKYSNMTFLQIVFLAAVAHLSHGAADFPALDVLRSKTPTEVQASAVSDLIQRVIGNRASDFLVSVDASIGPANRDTFKFVTSGGKLSITGTSGVAAAMGFYYYLKYYCGGQYTWAGQQTKLPVNLPLVSTPFTMTTNDRFRYYQNVCTVSYSFVWWDWPRWEREIDWMALQGINMPLAFTGQEAMFQRVFMALGFSFDDMEHFFGGPAYLAWARMGNIRGWGGPLPQAWMDNRLILQHKILKRMRSLGMTPVLPGFAGHVPAAITRVLPHAKVTRLGGWAGFGANYSETYLLDFDDPLFVKIGGSFIKALEAEYGVDHIYNADTFNEMTPKSSDPAYLASASRSVYQAMQAGDPKAIWLMQGWLFKSEGFWKPPQIKALLTAVPQGKMIILDLMSELSPIFSRTESYYGQPFIWCMLHNFGGTMELYGTMDRVNQGPFKGRTFPNSTMVGTGLTPEGINQNEVMYELMNEMAWRKTPVDLEQWVDSFQSQRYGATNKYATAAWQLLKASVYTLNHVHSDSNGVTITKRPSLKDSEIVWYKPEQLFQAWDNMVRAAQSPDLANSTLFRYDLVDVTRNSLQILTLKYYKKILDGYIFKSAKYLKNGSYWMEETLSDLDTLLGSDPHFLLGSWTQSALNFSTSVNETILYDLNSRNQVTLWGPQGQIRDYAAKQWSGLIKKYYLPRWQLFGDMLLDAVVNRTKFSTDAYNKKNFDTVELPFSNDHTVFPNTPSGDSIKIVNMLYKKYRPEMASAFFDQFPNKPTQDTAISPDFPRQWGRAYA